MHLLKEDKNANDVARILFGLNPNQATEFFFSPDTFSAGSLASHRLEGFRNESRTPKRKAATTLCPRLKSTILYERDNTIFDELDAGYFASSENVEVLATRYVLKSGRVSLILAVGTTYQ
ncbi:MAG: hypothetical protein KDN22_07840 [Verrucomicrobiae bacterium]|nr:hypothetical protein [Verrucomicrobiae bacterium]